VDTRAFGAELAERDIALIDAAVSGGPERAATGRLMVLAGGTAEHLERARVVLARWRNGWCIAAPWAPASPCDP
jgi:3-hydroxyisobutyrate dehydrogenase-like beta-hydroxyacid dehydrogenase